MNNRPKKTNVDSKPTATKIYLPDQVISVNKTLISFSRELPDNLTTCSQAEAGRLPSAVYRGQQIKNNMKFLRIKYLLIKLHKAI